MSDSPLSFADLDDELRDHRRAAAVVLPLPFERTTSWGKGTARGPEALLAASHYVEHYDEELDGEPCGQGVATAAPFLPAASDLETAIGEIEAEARRHLAGGKFLVTLGGEHSLSVGTVRAARSLVPDLGVVQFDAHADLRDAYQGSAYSHACTMRRIVDDGVATLAVGVRSLSTGEARLIRERNLPVIWGAELDRAEERFAELLETLPQRIYLTFDLDFFDPSLLPATGTPEPGGGFWTPTLRLLRHLFASRRVVAMDVVELAPIAGQPASDFIAAKLVMKCLGYRWRSGSRLGAEGIGASGPFFQVPVPKSEAAARRARRRRPGRGLINNGRGDRDDAGGVRDGARLPTLGEGENGSDR